MNHISSFATTLSVLLAGVTVAQARPEPIAPELAKAQARAAVHNKRVLAVLCADGEDFAAKLKKDRASSRKLLYEFETVQFTGKAADAQAVSLKFPDALQDKPALVVLDAEGKVLARLEAADVLNPGGLDSPTLLEQLEPYYCKPVDADKKLASALADAKKTGRNVFIRFDAPW